MPTSLIRPGSVEDRAYQDSITRACLRRPTLVVLPTGLGKTVIALRVLAETIRLARVANSRRSKILLLAPTKPLVEQHAKFLAEHLLPEAGAIAVATGEVPPAKRRALWNGSTVIVSTPQVVENDLGRELDPIPLDEVGLVIYDEAHRAVGNYAYVRIAESAKFLGTPAMAITASPGADAKKILAICQILGLTNVEIRSETDRDVAPYIHKTGVQVEEVSAPALMGDVVRLLARVRERCERDLQAAGYLRDGTMIGRRDLLEARGRIEADLRRPADEGGPVRVAYRAATTQAMAMKVAHAIELAQTQGGESLLRFLDRLASKAEKDGASRADRQLLREPEVEEAIVLARRRNDPATPGHPKIGRVLQIVTEELRLRPDSRAIVFAHYRDTADVLTVALRAIPGARPVRFVGHTVRGEDRGLRQKEQVEALQRFREGTFNLLVATSVGEEGLDIPDTDLVVFYEPVPSLIRHIQRRGRTGRSRAGRVVVLVTKGTRDQTDLSMSRSKERKMHSELAKLQADHRGEITVGGADALLPAGKGSTAAEAAPAPSSATVRRRESEDAILALARTPVIRPAGSTPPDDVAISAPIVPGAMPATDRDPYLPEGQTTIETFGGPDSVDSEPVPRRSAKNA